jgi:hypothetical protein
VGAGWHGHLDRLTRHLAGESVGWRDAELDRMHARYEQLTATP